MSYLAQPTSKTEYGVTKVGPHILVQDGEISLAQDVAPDAQVMFDQVDAVSELRLNGSSVITQVITTAGTGIQIVNFVDQGPQIEFEVTNTGVTSLIAGTGISISQSTGDVIISSEGADIMNVTGVTTNYTVTPTDEYVGVNSSVAVTISLPPGEPGRVYHIKDERGQGSGKITIQPVLGELVDGKLNYVIGVPYQSVAVVFRAGSWWLI
jgi:hypothetical protein